MIFFYMQNNFWSRWDPGISLISFSEFNLFCHELFLLVASNKSTSRIALKNQFIGFIHWSVRDLFSPPKKVAPNMVSAV